MDYKIAFCEKFCSFDDETGIFNTNVPLPLQGWYTIGKTITLGSYYDLNSAMKACYKYFNHVRPVGRQPGPTNLGTDVKKAVIFGHELEIETWKIILLKLLVEK